MASSLYRKKLIEPGTWQSGQGPVVVTPARISHWEKSFNDLRKEGFNFPVPWGHKLSAVPASDDPFAVEEAYARWNSGNIDRLEKDPDGSLWMVAETPPGYSVDAATKRLVNTKDGTVVTDVSPGIGNWTDGQGRQHKDIILHAALCTHPVQHNQTGFLPASHGSLPDGVRLLSTSGTIQFTHLLQTKGPSMADEPEDKKKDPKDKDDKAAPIGLEDDLPPDPDADPEVPPMPDGTEAPEMEMPKEKEESPVESSVKQDEYVQQLKEEMAKMGQPLMDDTDRNNIVERLLMALKHAANSGATLVPPKIGDESATPDLSVNGVPDTNGAGGMSGVGGYSFLSTHTRKVLQLEPSVAKFAAQAGDLEKANIAAEWRKLADMGPAGAQAVAHRETNLLNTQYLSVNPDTAEVMLRQGRERLAFAKTILKAFGAYEFLPKLLSTSVAALNPAHAETAAEADKQADLDDMLRRAYGSQASVKQK